MQTGISTWTAHSRPNLSCLPQPKRLIHQPRLGAQVLPAPRGPLPARQLPLLPSVLPGHPCRVGGLLISSSRDQAHLSAHMLTVIPIPTIRMQAQTGSRQPCLQRPEMRHTAGRSLPSGPPFRLRRMASTEVQPRSLQPMVMPPQSKGGKAEQRRAEHLAWPMGSWPQLMGPSWMGRLHRRHGLPACKVGHILACRCSALCYRWVSRAHQFHFSQELS